MRLVMTLLVRDEQDVVADTLDYHLARGVDHVIVTDNHSIDGTRRIVEGYCRRGLATLIDEPADDYAQSRWVTRMARMAATELGADWVINSDADEFWWPEDGELKGILERTPAETGALFVRRVNFLPLRTPPPCAVRAMVYRDVVSVNALGRALPGKVVHRAAADIDVGPGNHRAAAPSIGPTETTADLIIFHFPYRSYEQFAAKIANGGASMLKNTTVPLRAVAHWRELYPKLHSGELRTWFDARPHADDEDRQSRLDRGEVVRDDRLARYLAELDATRRSSRLERGNDIPGRE
jgi:hypothetical protein